MVSIDKQTGLDERDLRVTAITEGDNTLTKKINLSFCDSSKTPTLTPINVTAELET